MSAGCRTGRSGPHHRTDEVFPAFSVPWLRERTALLPFWFPRRWSKSRPQPVTKVATTRLPAALIPTQLVRRVKQLQNRFENPVTVRLGAEPRTVVSADEAARLLLDVDWPERGPGHRDASETCIKVIEGTRSAADARTAFLRAARESGILVE